MIFYLIPIIIIIVSLSIIGYTIFKKFPDLAAINVESIAEEKELKLKNQIMVDRLSRKYSDFRKLIETIFGPLSKKIHRAIDDFYKKIIELEKSFAQKTRPLKSFEVKNEAKKKVEEAKQLLAQEKLTEAEEVFIDVIKLDAKIPDAYEGLGQIYLANRDYKKARETYRYCVKLLEKRVSGADSSEKHRLSSCYADLGSIYQLEGKNQLALTNFNKAVGMEPNNPRFLDFLLKVSILLKNKDLAWKTFNALSEADPENKKLPELKEEISNLQTPVAKS